MKCYDIFNFQNERLGHAVEFSDGVLATHGERTGSAYYRDAAQFREIHPYWILERVG